MSWIGDTLSTLRKVVLLDHRVAELEKDMREAQRDINGHDRRIVQLETVIFGPAPPEHMRLPRQ